MSSDSEKDPVVRYNHAEEIRLVRLRMGGGRMESRGFGSGVRRHHTTEIREGYDRRTPVPGSRTEGGVPRLVP